MEQVTAWKRFKGLAIDYGNKIAVGRENLLLVTRLKHLAAHLSFVAVLLVIFWIFLDYAENQILEKVLLALEKALLSDAPINTAESLQSLSGQLKTTYALFFMGIMGVMGVIAYLLAGVALRPIRRNMESQRRFIADVSHELRTPLSVMQSEAEVALFDGATESDRKEALRVNIEEINRIAIIINNLVSFTHIGGLSQASFVRVDLTSVITRSVEKLRKLSKVSGVEVETHFGQERNTFGNEIALEQVVVNLVKNAISHTPRDGRVVVRCGAYSSTRISLLVEDTGSGISKEDVERIFEPFFKSGKSKIAERGSVGLGLTIVKEVLRSHHGNIFVESEFGEGTTFTVLLPKAQEKIS